MVMPTQEQLDSAFKDYLNLVYKPSQRVLDWLETVAETKRFLEKFRLLLNIRKQRAELEQQRRERAAWFLQVS